MAPSVLNTSAADSPLEGLIADYLQAASQGRTPDRDELLANHPGLSDELRAFFDGHDWMQQLAAPERISLENSQQTADTSDVFLQPTVTFDAPADQAAEEGIPQSGGGRFGDYVLLQEIARGGMGVVYKARQQSLNRVVALKMILGSRLATPADVERFYTEAEAAGHLDHPGIVPVYEVGQAESQHYYSMAYVEGMSLAELIQRDGVLSPHTAAQLLGRIAQAIGYAHQRGVIHRDLKPANILLARSEQSHAVTITGPGNQGQSGRYEPKVTDFGLAKRTDADSGLTGTGQILGTPSYMPPEQAAGKMDQVGPLADIYALGAMMYCMLTGRPPFQSANPMETLRQVVEEDPLPARRLNPSVPRDLETICMKCLQRDPSRRYDNANTLAEDLRRFMAGEPIVARAIAAWERGWKWVRRRPAAAGLIIACLVTVMTLVGFVTSLRYRGELERLLSSRRVMLAHQHWRDNEIIRAQELLNVCPTQHQTWEWDYVERLCRTGLVRTMKSPIAHACSIAYSHNGRYVAAGSGRGPVRVWDAATGEEIVTFTGHSETAQSVDFSPDGQRLASASEATRRK